ncbi:MAG: DUF455 family protein [Bacteriovoracaceae bacterium]|jgi:uncharacterized ferritin-like protein (DUF455 family)|nr:DUF455 family protein [Bacteriovoracaceae bacterium]
MNEDLELARLILESTNLKDKLIFFEPKPTITDVPQYLLPALPGRSKKHSITNKKAKFPKKGTLKDLSQRAKALHFFANHELLAIEMMAAAYLMFPQKTKEDLLFKKGLISTLIDEQKHFKLYVERINELGVEFGDFPLGGFFWSFMPKINSVESYLASVSLTFEAANLDFAKYYMNLFHELGDTSSADIMNTIYTDEIVHVSFGRSHMQLLHSNQKLWDSYIEYLPEPLTPERSKGIEVDIEARVKAGLSDQFIKNVQTYTDDFPITKRKEWKQNSTESI